MALAYRKAQPIERLVRRERDGAVLRQTGEITRVRPVGGRVEGVTLAGSVALDAPAVVNAAGAFAALADLNLPVTHPNMKTTSA